MQLFELIDKGVLMDLTAEGYVRKTEHPTEPLAILNYTDKAQVASASELWDHIYYGATVRRCRGLIYRTDTGEVVATPFPKFFNYGQGGADTIELNEPVTVVDKIDGSLGILYVEPTTGLRAIATRGSFTSEQAIHATALFRKRYADWSPSRNDWWQGTTFLFEIVYPGNRIVVDYGDTDDLVLLGSIARNGDTFSSLGTHWVHEWPGHVAEVFEYATLAEALAAPNRPNREGFVVMAEGPTVEGRMVKIKQEDYILLHRLVTGLSERRVWELIVAGESLQSIQEPLPDEFHDWVKSVYMRIKSSAIYTADSIRQTHLEIMDQTLWEEETDGRENKKRYALAVKDDPNAAYYFMLYNGKGAGLEATIIKKELQPAPYLTPANAPKEV